MSANTFMLACRALWGSQWQSEAARGLGISLSSRAALRQRRAGGAAGSVRALSEVIDERLAEHLGSGAPDFRTDEAERNKAIDLCMLRNGWRKVK